MIRALLAILLLALPLSAAEKTNVLFIAVDDLRPALGCLGDPAAKTPNIDKLATGGTAFLRAYCQQAVCSPSRSSLLTGCRPDTTKVYDLVTHFRTHIPNVVTLPQHFKQNGYHVRGVGKIYHGGYDDPPSWSEPWERPKGFGFGPAGQKELATAKEAAKKKNEDVTKVRGLPTEAPEVDDEYLNDGAVAKRAIELLRANKEKGQPFFLAVGFLKPHLPFVAPKKYWDMQDVSKLPKPGPAERPKNAPAFAPQNGGELRAYIDMPKSGPIPEADAKKLVHGYYAAVSYMDAQVGKVLDELKALGLDEDTVVVLWGDHGWHLGDHGMWCKHTNYEKATRAALVVRAPKQKFTGKPTKSLVEFVDIYPTLTQLCGLPKPAHLEGHSFAKLLDDPNAKGKTAAFSQYPRGSKETGPLMGYAMKTDRYRYVEWRDRKTGEVKAKELYDHEVDPNEDVNIAGSPASGVLLQQLESQMKAGWKGAATK
ncbi:MAG: sulfatase [Planctomycetia bacterium]|nr:sulfatase [Planctomycetia bacterium]